ncbi:IS3 family transposase, partial [Methylobacterium sp. J-070]|uniref:IS3 family transposase n=1 Tax=Methylobacterium sp. J-070 TaxID=2836650 RepID=UPI001FB8E212
MGLARSTFYDAPRQTADDTALVASMSAIDEPLEAYGCRRVQAALRKRALVVNHNTVRRLMRGHDLQPRIGRGDVTTSDGYHGGPVFPNLARDTVLAGADQRSVADLPYVAGT